MRIPTFSRTPEQLSLFNVPRRAHYKLRLKRFTFVILFIALWATGGIKLIAIIQELMDLRPPWGGYLLLRGERHEFLWFLWLVLTLLFMHFTRKGLFGKNVPTWSGKLVVAAALLVYLFEVALVTIKYINISASDGVPWSFYVLGPCLAILTLWKLPALQLTQWKDKLEAKDYLTIVNSTRTLLLQMIGGAIVIAGLYYTSQSMSIAQENVRLSLLKDEAERLSQAINQLKDENPEVRLVAIHNLQTVAPKSVSNYRLISTIFERYVRAHAAWRDAPDQLSAEGLESRADIESALSFLGNRGAVFEALQNDKARSGIDARDISTEDVDRVAGKINLQATDLRGLDLPESMSGWVLSSAHLEMSSLTRADLVEASLDNANLSDSDLRYAYLIRANLKGANLSRANLKDVKLRDANVEGADFNDAINLTVKQIREAKNYDKAKLPPAISAELNR